MLVVVEDRAEVVVVARVVVVEVCVVLVAGMVVVELVELDVEVDVVVVPWNNPPIDVLAVELWWPRTSENDSPITSSITVTAPRLRPNVSAIAAANDQCRPAGRPVPVVGVGIGGVGFAEMPCSELGTAPVGAWLTLSGLGAVDGVDNPAGASLAMRRWTLL